MVRELVIDREAYGSWGREGNGNPLQCSCLENPMDRGNLQSIVLMVAESDMTTVT